VCSGTLSEKEAQTGGCRITGGGGGEKPAAATSKKFKRQSRVTGKTEVKGHPESAQTKKFRKDRTVRIGRKGKGVARKGDNCIVSVNWSKVRVIWKKRRKRGKKDGVAMDRCMSKGQKSVRRRKKGEHSRTPPSE